MSSSPRRLVKTPAGPRPGSLQVDPPDPSFLLPPDFSQKSEKPPRVEPKNRSPLLPSVEFNFSQKSEKPPDKTDVIFIITMSLICLLAVLYIGVSLLW